MECTQVLTSHSCTDHSSSMCYSLFSAGTCCLRYDTSPAKKVETYFYPQCFSVVWIILLTTKKKTKKTQLLQHCQVVLPIVQKDPEIPKFMTANQKDIPELTGVLTRTTAWVWGHLHYGAQSFQHQPAAKAARVFKHFAALPGAILLRPSMCSHETQISTAVMQWPWVWRVTLQQTLKWIRAPAPL